MASSVNGVMYHLKYGSDGTEYALASGAYGVCGTAQATAAKTVDMTGFALATGVTIHVKFTYASVAGATLNVNGTGAIAIKRYGTTDATGTAGDGGWAAGSVVDLTYDGSYWIMNSGNGGDSQVTQNASTTNGDFPILGRSTSAGTTTVTGQTSFTTKVLMNPSTGVIKHRDGSRIVADIQSGSTQPTNQVSGDIWFETLS